MEFSLMVFEKEANLHALFPQKPSRRHGDALKD